MRMQISRLQASRERGEMRGLVLSLETFINFNAWCPMLLVYKLGFAIKTMNFNRGKQNPNAH